MSLGTSGMFIGICEDNNDPLKLGRLKVRVPIIYGNIPIEDIPWSEPCFSYAFHDQGIFFIPEIGSFIVIWFLNGSKYKPVWVGGIHREDDNIIPQIAKENYPERKTIKTKTGYITFDDKDNIITLKHKSGSEIIFGDEGDVIVHSARDIHLISDRHIHENTKKYSVTPIPEYKKK